MIGCENVSAIAYACNCLINESTENKMIFVWIGDNLWVAERANCSQGAGQALAEGDQREKRRTDRITKEGHFE